MRQLLNWFRLRNLESGLDRELKYHIDRRVADLMHSGLPEPEARRQAALELGGVTHVKEEVRDIWLTRWLRDLAYDLRLSARSFLRTPAFTTTAVLSLALGIGATTAIYSLVPVRRGCRGRLRIAAVERRSRHLYRSVYRLWSCNRAAGLVRRIRE